MAAAGGVAEHGWVPAVGMEHSELAVVGYLPGTWPKDAGIVCVARRTRIPVENIPTGRARKRRTIAKDQLALALQGRLDAVYGYSVILTNLDLGDPEHDPDGHAEKLAEVQWWYREAQLAEPGDVVAKRAHRYPELGCQGGSGVAARHLQLGEEAKQPGRGRQHGGRLRDNAEVNLLQ